MPANTAIELAPLAAATARSGRAGASAPSTTSMIRWQVCARDGTGAGKTALTSVPGAARDLEHVQHALVVGHLGVEQRLQRIADRRHWSRSG